jgi:hypothetical protein
MNEQATKCAKPCFLVSVTANNQQFEKKMEFHCEVIFQHVVVITITDTLLLLRQRWQQQPFQA